MKTKTYKYFTTKRYPSPIFSWIGIGRKGFAMHTKKRVFTFNASIFVIFKRPTIYEPTIKMKNLFTKIS